MTTMNQLLNTLWNDERGQDLTEYALLLTLIAVFSIATLRSLASVINNTFANTVTQFSGT
jgi:Flp pilus assembly pilin Flp